MKKQFTKFLIGVFLFLFINSCGEDVDSLMEPDQAKVITDIELQNSEQEANSDIEVPELKPIDLIIIKIYNDGTQEQLTATELSSHINWEVESNKNLSVIKDPETGKARVQGQGTGYLSAVFKSDAGTGYKRLVSNSLTVRTTAAEITGIEVKPAEKYSVGCELSNSPNTEVVEGCLMQFQAIAHYNNDEIVDVTDVVEWNSEIVTNNLKADLLTEILDSSVYENKLWYSTQSATINSLKNKKGLVLGYNDGSFQIKASYNEVNLTNKTDTLRVSSSELYSMSAQIVMPGESTCSNNCLLVENTSIKIEAKGTYTNNRIDPDITRNTQISVTPSDSNVDILQAGVQYTGEVEIHYLAPTAVDFTIKKDTLEKKIHALIAKEKIVELHQELPEEKVLDGDISYISLISRTSNTDIYFLLDAKYNNSQFTVLDKDTRQIDLNTEIFNTWEINNNSDPVILIDERPTWTDKGYRVTTFTEPETPASATVIAQSADRNLSWEVIINDSSSKAESLSINLGDQDLDIYAIKAGELTPFSVMAVFDNSTSRALENSEIIWDTSPDTCLINLVNPKPEKCIDSSGDVNTYQPLTIIATTRFFEPNISTNISLSLTVTGLTAINIDANTIDFDPIDPDTPVIYGKDSAQFTAIGSFDNNRTHILPGECVEWTIDPIGHATISNIPESSGYLTAYDVAGEKTISVKAKSVLNCGGAIITPGRFIEGDITATQTLRIRALPTITIASLDTVGEDDSSPREVTIQYTGPAFDRIITIPFAITGSATSGIDYEALPGYAVIPAGESKVTLDILTIPDDLNEYNETLTITLLENGLVNGRLSDNASETRTTVSIIDDVNDKEPTLSIDPLSSNGNEGDIIQLEVGLDKISGRDIKVNFDITGDVTPEDYSFPNTVTDYLIIPAGEQTVTLDIQLEPEGSREGQETLIVDVSADHVLNPQSVGSATLNITDIDYLQIKDPLGTIECSVGDTRTISIDVNAQFSAASSSITLYGNPDWITIPGGAWEIAIDCQSVQEVNDIQICAKDFGESSCDWFNVKIQ